MSWLEKIRTKPHEEKLKIIWIITGSCFLILILLWVILGNPERKADPNTTIFKTIGNSFQDTIKQIKEMPKTN